MIAAKAAFLMTFLAASGATVLPAQAQYTRFNSLTDFGDSYADTGFAPGGVLRLPPFNFPCPNGPALLPTCRFTGGTNFVDSLQSIYGLPQAANFAFGGALTDTTNTLPTPGFPQPGFVQELAIFAASGMRFTDRDLIALSIGGNDSTLGLTTDSNPQLAARATTAALNAVAGVQQLIAAGARNIAWLSPGNSFYFPAANGQPLTFGQHTAWSDTTTSRFSNCWRRRRVRAFASSCSTSGPCRRGSRPIPACTVSPARADARRCSGKIPASPPHMRCKTATSISTTCTPPAPRWR